MDLCDNAFCSAEIVEVECVSAAGRRFCCIACAEDWKRQNEALIEAAAPFHIPPRDRDSSCRSSSDIETRRLP